MLEEQKQYEQIKKGESKMRLEVHTHSYPYCLVVGREDKTVNVHIHPVDHGPDLIKEGK